MNKLAAIIIGGSLLLVGGLLVFAQTFEVEKSPTAQELVLHKSPTCGCCGVWGNHMSRKGYEVETRMQSDMAATKAELGVPASLESCHTAQVGGYIVEGHIPEEVIEKLLASKPDIKGIGMPGMPAGSPGMPGPKTDEFVIYEIEKSGEKGEVFMTI